MERAVASIVIKTKDEILTRDFPFTPRNKSVIGMNHADVIAVIRKATLLIVLILLVVFSKFISYRCWDIIESCGDSMSLSILIVFIVFIFVSFCI